MLQRGSCERRSRRTLALLTLYVGDPVARKSQPLDVNRGVGLGGKEEALLVRAGGQLAFGDLGEPGRERLLGLTLGRQPDIDAPVFNRVERFDLALALDYQADCHRLNASGRQARPHTPPKDRRDPVPDQAVKDPARLLSVDELHIDPAGTGDRLEDRVPRYLGERCALRLGQVHAEQGRHVERDSLALAVVVGGQDQVIGSAQS